MKTNFSSRRQAVIDVLKSTKEHPSAESVYDECKKVIPSISLGTVYRNLALLEEQGDIIKVATVNGKDRYDADLSPHNHIVCRSCGKVSDASLSDALKSVLDKEEKVNHYTGYNITFFANCENCRNN
ncbi:MAG: transcriptional repressor [Clostridia bacterium]